MGIFSGNKKKDDLVLVFDIGSSSVGGALFYVQGSKIPKVIFSVREPVVLLEEMDLDQFFSLTIKSLSVVASKIAKSGVGSPSRIFCVLSSLWYASQTRTIRLEKNIPFVFNTKLADGLIQKEILLFEEEHAEKYKNTDNKVLPIELKNMKTMLNGYDTPQPLNQKAKDLEMTIFISMSSEQFIKKVQEVVASHFHREDIKFSSFAMISFAVARGMFVQEENFLLLDIGAEVTDISMIKKGILSESVSFPVGRNFIIRGVSKALSTTLDEARALVSLYKDGHADVETQKRLEPVIEGLRGDWLKSFQESLANVSNDISIPSTIFVTIEEDLAEFFGDTVKKEQFNQYTLTESKFKVIFLNAPILHTFIILDKNVSPDPGLMIESIYINHFLS